VDFAKLKELMMDVRAVGFESEQMAIDLKKEKKQAMKKDVVGKVDTGLAQSMFTRLFNSTNSNRNNKHD